MLKNNPLNSFCDYCIIAIINARATPAHLQIRSVHSIS